MSIRDPMKWLKEQQPGNAYDSITLRFKDVMKASHPYSIDAFTKRNIHSYNAVLDWLEKSGIYIWPYAEAAQPTKDIKEVTITMKIDCARLGALYISGEASLDFNLAEHVARTLTALSNHVYLNTKGTIFINVPK